MAGDENQLLAGVQKAELGRHFRFGLWIAQRVVANPVKGINDGVAGNFDTVFSDAFTKQVRCRAFGRGEMQGRKRPCDLAVHLFRPRGIDIACAKARFDMADGNLLVIGGHRGGHGGGGIAMHEHPVRLHFLIGGFQSFEYGACNMGKALRRLHHVKISVGDDAEQVSHLNQHLAVLARQTNAGPNIVTGLECLNDRGHLDRFRPCAEDADDVRHSRGGHGWLAPN